MNKIDIYQELRLKWRDTLTGGDLYDEKDPDILKKLVDIDLMGI